MEKHYILECCVDSVASAIQAKKGGADRLELCSNLIIETVDIEKIRSEYNALSTKKKSLQKNYQSAKNDCDSLQKNLDNLQQYLD